MAAAYGITRLSTYVLFNYADRPIDFYRRLRVIVELNEELGIQIHTFPMRYISLESRSRSVDSPGNMGKHWNKKYLRAIQCVLVRTRGVVGIKMPYFEKAFGRAVDDFQRILIMPEDYIMNRLDREADGSTDRWWREYNDLSGSEKEELLGVVLTNSFRRIDRSRYSRRVLQVLDHYVGEWDPQLSMFPDSGPAVQSGLVPADTLA